MIPYSYAWSQEIFRVRVPYTTRPLRRDGLFCQTPTLEAVVIIFKMAFGATRLGQEPYCMRGRHTNPLANPTRWERQSFITNLCIMFRSHLFQNYIKKLRKNISKVILLFIKLFSILSFNGNNINYFEIFTVNGTPCKHTTNLSKHMIWNNLNLKHFLK